jgi:hypothetical protein
MPLVAIKIPGLTPEPVIQTDFLPPVGSRLELHKHLFGGKSVMAEVTGYQWFISDGPVDPSDKTGHLPMSVAIVAKVV